MRTKKKEVQEIYDIILKIKLCRVHKEYCDIIGLDVEKWNLGQLMTLLHFSRMCKDCKWC